MLRVKQDQDIIQININAKILVMAMEQDGFDKGDENFGGCSKPKGQDLSPIRCSAKQITKSDDDDDA